MLEQAHKEACLAVGFAELADALSVLSASTSQDLAQLLSLLAAPLSAAFFPRCGGRTLRGIGAMPLAVTHQLPTSGSLLMLLLQLSAGTHVDALVLKVISGFEG